MKKILIAVLFLSLLIVVPAKAMETNTYTGTASYSHPFLVAFTTNRVGDVVANAQWTPKSGIRYVLTVKHLLDPNDPMSYDLICQVYEPLGGGGSGQTVGDYTCSFAGAPTGYWTAEFRPDKGKVGATISIAAETD